MLDSTAAIVLFLGAIFITMIGAMMNYISEDKTKPGNNINIKTLLRDFVIGFALTSTAYFFNPESFHSLGKSIQEVKLPTELGGTTDVLGTDIEVGIGPAKF